MCVTVFASFTYYGTYRMQNKQGATLPVKGGASPASFQGGA